MNLDAILPLGSSLLSFVFCLFLIDQWRERRKSFQAIWAIGMLWYGLSAGAQFVGAAFGWNDILYRLWYLIGAIWVAAWLGLGTTYLLARTRFGYAFALSFFLAGLFTFLTDAKYHYPDSGIAPIVYFVIAIGIAVLIALDTYGGGERWPSMAAVAIGGGTLITAFMAASAHLAAPGYVLDPVTRIPTGDLFPGYLRLLTPFFNITGAFALILGAIYSAYVFMPKQRVIRYTLRRGQAPGELARNLVLAPVAVAVNFLVSLPGAIVALFNGRLNSRVPSTILIALGGLVASITSGLNRFGNTSGFAVGQFIGVLFLFAGFLVSIEVFSEVRIPFTHVVLHVRHAHEVP